MATRARRRGVLAVLAAASLLLVGACGDDDGGGDDDGASGTTVTTTDEGGDVDDLYGDDTTASTTAGSAAIETAMTDLGEVLVSDGMTLYVFTEDTDGVSTCYEGCATTWPPLLAPAEGEVEVGGDLDAGLFDTSVRDDGTSQVTVDGQPLYFYAPDEEPGDVTGQGVGGVWFVVGPDGALIEDSAE